MTPLAEALQMLMAAFDRLEVRFVLGGSVASSTHGLSRQTNDVDIVAELTPELAADFCGELSRLFYADPDAARDAVRNGRPFNVIHLHGAYKFDIFPICGDPFGRAQVDGRRFMNRVLPGLEEVEVPLLSAEDTIIAKLRWFRAGGEVSDRQWHDVLGVIRVQGRRLDLDYVREWASKLALTHLVDRALAGSG